MQSNRCVILVPANGPIETACERSLRELELRGYSVWRVGGYAAIDAARNQMATDALAKGFEELFWIDSDIEFQPDDVERLRSHELPLVSGIYAKKGQRALASNVLPSTKQIVFGKEGGLIEIGYAATGFLLTRRQVYVDVQRTAGLKVCNRQFGRPLVPYFMPMVAEVEDGPWYMGEDFAFSHRARQAGHKIMADSTIRLGHIGRHSFQWEEAGITQQRFATFTYHFGTGEGDKQSGQEQKKNEH